MSIFKRYPETFPTSLIYITVGTLTAVWTIVYWAFNAPATRTGYLWVVGFLMTGLSLLAIGLVMGLLGRAARITESPPVELAPIVTQNLPAVVSSGPIASDRSHLVSAPTAGSEPASTLLKTD